MLLLMEQLNMSILSTAYSALNAYQLGLQVTGNNLVNAETQGYTRQSIAFTPSPSNYFAGSYVGSGVEVTSIYRNVDQFLNAQLRSTITQKSQFDTFYQQSMGVNSLLAQDGNSISTSMQSFFTALSDLNGTPDNIASRNVVLKQSSSLANQFKTMQKTLDDYQSNSTMQLSMATGTINQLTTSLASVNKQLMGTPDAPELADQRDELLRQLSQFSQLSIFGSSGGAVNVGLPNGEMLVTGASHSNLSVVAGSANNLGSRILLDSGSGKVDVTDRLQTGSLGALLDYEQNVLAQTNRAIGQLAIGLSQSFNAQHQLGMDMNDQLGKNFFTDYNSAAAQLKRAISSTANTGSGVLSVQISDIGQTQLSDYKLVVSDSASNEVKVTRLSDGTVSTLTWTNTPPAPPAGQLELDGMTITVNDTSLLANQDEFTLLPTRGAAGDFALQITDPRQIALASPVVTSAATTNEGKGTIAFGTLLNTNDVSKQFRIDFISDTQYNVVNVTDATTDGPLTLVPNTDNTIQIPDSLNPSYTVTISGAPQAGDQFNSVYNAGGIADSRNGLALSGIQQAKILSSGGATLFDGYANLLTDIGSQTKQAGDSAISATSSFKSAKMQQSSVSGVNRDEEGANLLKYKQAYEAAGKLMAVCSEIMDMLFQMMR